ncbi:acyl carrier protein [Actinomadura sp. GC306]|uniref:phosphopantetheine-binding protein n=1 Tax=Actinomadura sp. GC306 TaxID=2530367 RepID=UPI001044023A|nr:phosphopantetheine-binding protein [Actinomadura sp. GC306]TDC60031.1 acyl carrier protein [Actinomadura sp. GC306]
MNDDLAEVVRILTDVLGEDNLRDVEIGPETTFTDALALESIEFAAFAGKLRDHYGDRAGLPALVAGLDLDELLDLTVGDVADHFAGAAR